MQSYLNQMILPIMSADLGARHLYGLITGVSSIVAMLGLPFGAALLQRYQLPRLLLVMTLILCAGAIVSATAPNIGLYLSGLVIRGFAGSALAMTSIGAVALGLSGRARQLTLAFSSASWVISSLVGPTYAAWVTHLLSWRWAMLLYLPFLLIARFIVAANLRSRQKTKKAPLPFSAALGAGLGIFLTIVPLQGIGKYLLGLLGLAILGLGDRVPDAGRNFLAGRAPQTGPGRDVLFDGFIFFGERAGDFDRPRPFPCEFRPNGMDRACRRLGMGRHGLALRTEAGVDGQGLSAAGRHRGGGPGLVRSFDRRPRPVLFAGSPSEDCGDLPVDRLRNRHGDHLY